MRPVPRSGQDTRQVLAPNVLPWQLRTEWTPAATPPWTTYGKVVTLTLGPTVGSVTNPADGGLSFPAVSNSNDPWQRLR